MFEILSFKIKVVQNSKGITETEAILKVNVNGRTEAVIGDGNDIKDAFHQALRKALLSAYPCLAELKIVCYEVFGLKDNSFVLASFVFLDGEERWADLGEAANACEAILKALVAGFKRTIFRRTTEETG